MSEKSRNMMLKSTGVSSGSHGSSSFVPMNVLRGNSIRTALESANHPTPFIATSSEFDNSIIVACPPTGLPPPTNQAHSAPVVEDASKSSESVEPVRRKVSPKPAAIPISGLDGSPTIFVPFAETVANNPYVVSSPSVNA